jgi:hypothetical protein
MGLLAACMQAEKPFPAPAFYNLDDGGIEVADGKRIDFGRTQSSTVSAMHKIMGITEGEAFECGDLVVVTLADGVALVFAQNQFSEWSFRGWQTEERSAGKVCPLS